MQRYLIGLLVSLALAAGAQAQTTYTPSDAIIPNPDRGFYRYTETRSENYTPLVLSDLQWLRANENITLIFRYYFLKDFVDAPISQSYLDMLEDDLKVLRQAGSRIILRFAYTDEVNGDFDPPFGDAPKSRVLEHIAQAGPILEKYPDAIAAVQMGFIGIWGEGFYTDYFADPNNPDDISPQQFLDRREVLSALLAAIPPERLVQQRYIFHKPILFGVDPPLDESSAFDGSDRARTGYHNDCYLASDTDYGTYRWDHLEEDKNYLAAETAYVPIGGETCNVNPPRSECAVALAEFERFHYSYMNDGYHPDVLQSWKDGDCYDEIQKLLGYRLVLQTSTIPAAVAPDRSLDFSLSFMNEGWSAPFNPMLVQLVARNRDTGLRHSVLLEQEARKWYAGDQQTLDYDVGIPAGMPAGSYDLLLHVTDPTATPAQAAKAPGPGPSIVNPNLAIQFANTGTWESVNGYNLLGSFNVSGGGGGPPFNPDLAFQPLDVSLAIRDTEETDSNPDLSFSLGAVYPNPAMDALTVEYGVAVPGKVEIRLIDPLGRIHLRETLSSEQGPQTTTLRVDAISPGIYLIDFAAAGRRFSRPVVIAR